MKTILTRLRDFFAERGDFYYQGEEHEVNYVKATFYFRVASLLGDAYSAFRLAYIYEYGLGCKVDCRKALRELQKAVSRGDIDSMVCIGDLYRTGELGEPEFDTALYWYHRSADHGNLFGALKEYLLKDEISNNNQ